MQGVTLRGINIKGSKYSADAMLLAVPQKQVGIKPGGGAPLNAMDIASCH
jgi:hypothetical protein